MKTLRLSLVILAVVALPVAAQQRGVISGQVLERASGRPIPFAIVDVTGPDGSSMMVRADSAGQYRLPGVFAGKNVVRARGIGYTPSIADSVHVRDAAPATLNFVLGALPQVLQQERGGEVEPRKKRPRP